ncbi:HAMP domain-containing sensor histidine kinase [Advenella sp. FME57]|uniref:sensor histidine kinase n=1 Tax=Advenella sp. FME57 TaxID=2742604 RepID=UPI00186617BA|nr:HAMP domain-containing sensor histidine kinase [Advenella sp. FME57]
MIRQFVRFLDRTWNSISFRLTFNYGMLAIFSILVLMAFIYLQVVGALHSQLQRQIASATHRLVTDFETGGSERLIRSLAFTLSDNVDSDQGLYLLLNQTGEKVIGNLDAAPVSRLSEIAEADVSNNGVALSGRFRVSMLDDGSTLVVGVDLAETNRTIGLIGQACLVTLFVALMLVIVGTFIFRRELDFRVSSIHKTATQISSGQLSSRIPLSEIHDEFYHLSHEINSMLDRIEALMKGVRHVSDTIAHNLRTPLTRIISRLRTVQRPGHSAQEVLQATHFAVQEIENLNQLFEKLLQISEIEAGVYRQRFRICDFSAIADDVIDLYSAFAEDRRHQLSLNIRGDCQIHGDADLLASMLANLVDNALKYTREHVWVSLHGEQGQLSIRIEDDGPGIPASEYGNVGKHFYQLDPNATGFGLGLKSVMAIVAMHEGTLMFEDCRPGLRITIVFPIEQG